MWIDVLFLLIILLAVFKGLQRGFLLAFFSAVAFIIGLAAAMKLSAAVAGYLKGSVHITTRWLPVLAFIGVFLVVVLLVRGGARLIEAAIDMAMMGWLNKLAGVVLYALIYTIILSVLLFYAIQVHLVSGNTLAASVTYRFIRPFGPVVIDGFGKLVPLFRDMFAQLEDYFGQLNHKLS